MHHTTEDVIGRNGKDGDALTGSSVVIVCARCGGPILAGQQVMPMFPAHPVHWREHPVLSKPPAVHGMISPHVSPGRADMSVGDQLRQRAAMGGDTERAALTAFEEMLSNCIADAIMVEMRNEDGTLVLDVSTDRVNSKAK